MSNSIIGVAGLDTDQTRQGAKAAPVIDLAFHRDDDDYLVAQDPAVEVRRIAKNGYSLSNVKALSRRGVMWLGQTCNLRCYFCYFIDKIKNAHHPEHAFMSFEKAKELCLKVREVYGNTAIDIQGGEPSICPYIYDLIRYCNGIGLKPTLITNALWYDKPKNVEKLASAGVFDLLISIHGIGETYDRIVGVPGGSARQMKALELLQAAGVPFRFNTTLCRETLPELRLIAETAVRFGARSVNYIAFNPFVDQSSRRPEDQIPRYSDQARMLMPVIDYLDANEIEVNIRYMPFCVFPEPYRKFVQNFQQIIYDLHEWETESELWSGGGDNRVSAAPCPPLFSIDDRLGQLRPKAGGVEGDPFYVPELGPVAHFSEREYRTKEYRVLQTRFMHPYTKEKECHGCALTGICDGFHRDYAKVIGFGEARPEEGPVVHDPRHYQRHQMKVVEDQEADWVFRGADPVAVQG